MNRSRHRSRFSLSDYIVDAPSTPLTPWFALHKSLCNFHGLRFPLSYILTILVFALTLFIASIFPHPFGPLFVTLLLVQVGAGFAMTVVDIFRR